MGGDQRLKAIQAFETFRDFQIFSKPLSAIKRVLDRERERIFGGRENIQGEREKVKKNKRERC